MNAGARLALYGAGLAVAFGGAFALAGVLTPDAAVSAWTERDDVMQGHGEHAAAAGGTTASELKGLSSSAGGWSLADLSAPAAIGERGTLAFRVRDDEGRALTRYTTSHDKDLHLIVVRSDGGDFRHVHPELDADSGLWSLPWTWAEAGTYRVYADFTPADGSALTLAGTLHVAGAFTPVIAEPSRTAEIDGYTLALRGELRAGRAEELTLAVARDGEPVTTLEPYLGAFGHLVVLRQSDLAFLHVHPEGAEPGADDRGGPEISFRAEAPTAGRYLVYLDFQIDGEVRTAPFVLDAAPQGAAAPAPSTTPEHEDADEPHSH